MPGLVRPVPVIVPAQVRSRPGCLRRDFTIRTPSLAKTTDSAHRFAIHRFHRGLQRIAKRVRARLPDLGSPRTNSVILSITLS